MGYTIKIPLPPTRPRERRITLEEGELVLIARSIHFNQAGFPSRALLGVIGEEPENPQQTRIPLATAYIIRPTITFGGVSIPDVTLYSQLPTSYRVNAGTKVLTVGREDILKKIKSWPTYEAHATWVAQLKKPYVIKASE